MYYKYTTTAGATAVNFCADLALLMCGGVIANCSSACDQVNSVVLANTIASPWKLFDTYTDTYGTWSVLYALDADGITTKYVTISQINSTSVALQVYESWNAATHTGVNPAGSSYTWAISGITAREFRVLATPTTLLFSSITSNPFIITEFSRDAVYLKQKAYPVTVALQLNGSYDFNLNGSVPRVKNFKAYGDLLNRSVVFCGPTFSELSSTGVRDGTEGVSYPIYPLWVVDGNGASNYTSSPSNFAVILGQLIDLCLTTPNLGAPFDEFSDGTDTYILLMNLAAGPRLTIKKG